MKGLKSKALVASSGVTDVCYSLRAPQEGVSAVVFAVGLRGRQAGPASPATTAGFAMKPRVKANVTKKSKELGAVAVEFALILPIFLALILGVVEFGRAFSIQVSMAEGAREAARYSAIHYTEAGYLAAAKQKAIDAAPIADLQPGEITISTCGPDRDAVVSITANTAYLTGLPTLLPLLPDIMSISAKGVMRCGG